VSDARQLIAARYAGRIDAARAAAAAGRPVVGYAGLDVPEDLILGMGMTPLRLEADLQAPTDAAARFGAGGHPVLRSLVARLLGGPYDFIDHLVIGSMPRYLTALPILIRQLHGSDSAFARFHVHQLDVLHGASPSARQFTQRSMAGLAAVLAQWSGHAAQPERLCAAIAACNETRRQLRQFQQLRNAGQHCDGVAALQLYGCATGTDREQFNAQLRDWLQTGALHVPPAASPTPRVIYSGSATDTTALYASIEAQGLAIVDDDQDYGARAAGPLVDEAQSPLSAIAAAADRAPASAGWLTAERRAWLSGRIAACKPDGLIFHHAAYDHPPAWEYPALRAMAESLGVRCALLDPGAYRQPETVPHDAQEFARQLRAPPRAASA
jgi:benzoyl-CoA reductase/2-hydroxyglutaryl-CoA dehydratase subunit BcrC/BadD/HgdB